MQIEADLKNPPKLDAPPSDIPDPRLIDTDRRRRRRRRHTSTHRPGTGGKDRDSKGRVIVPGEHSLLESPDLATLEVSSSSRAMVYINGRKMGPTKLIKRLRPGTYTVWLQKGAKSSKSRVFRLEKGQKKKLFLEFEP